MRNDNFIRNQQERVQEQRSWDWTDWAMLTAYALAGVAMGSILFFMWDGTI